VTTREKIEALVAHLRTMRIEDADPSSRDIVELFQICEGLGFDPLGMLLPARDADADMQVDALITLLLEVRGDDLPAYDFARHVRDATATDDAEAEA